MSSNAPAPRKEYWWIITVGYGQQFTVLGRKLMRWAPRRGETVQLDELGLRPVTVDLVIPGEQDFILRCY